MEFGKRLYQSKWFLRVIVITGIVGLVAFESFWRIRVESGPEAAEAISWLKHNNILEPECGQIVSIDLERIGSRFMWTFGRPESGRFHFLVTGEKDKIDILLLWHVGESGQPIIVDRVQSIYDKSGEPIWKRPAKL